MWTPAIVLLGQILRGKIMQDKTVTTTGREIGPGSFVKYFPTINLVSSGGFLRMRAARK